MDNSIKSSDLTTEQKVILDAVYRIDTSRNNYNNVDKVKFEKILFLLSKKFPDELDYLNETFDAYAMGPYNEYLDDVMDSLLDLRLVKDYKTITEDGKRVLEGLNFRKAERKIDQALKELVVFSANLSTDDLLYIVYKLYPSYAEKSNIWHRINSDKFETIEIPVENITQNDTRTIHIKSDRGNTVKVTIKDGKVELL
jgi:hypothetical protein